MKILVLHRDIFVLAGDARAMFMFADVFKYLGHEVLFLYTDMRPQSAWFFTKETFRQYHPVKYIDFFPERTIGKPPKQGVLEGDFQMVDYRFTSSRVYDYIVADKVFDVFFTDEAGFMFWGDDLDWLKEIFYVHWTFFPRGPEKTTLWTNSSYTKEAIKHHWGRSDAEVVYPPLWVDQYTNNYGFHDRDIDVVMFAQLYPGLKGLTLAEEIAKEGFKVVVIGARIEDYNPELVEVRTNLTVDEYIDILSRSKVYIHAKVGEHFGITVTEAMACGAVPVVHATGGPYTDIIDKGKYGLYFHDVDVIDKIKKLTSDEKLWERYHELAVERVWAFDVSNVADTVADLLERM